MNMLAKLLTIISAGTVVILSACGGGGGGGGTATYSVIYDGNGSTGGSVPVDGTAYKSGDTVTVADNTGGLSRTHFTFAGWNTRADNSGTSYTHGQTFTMGGASVTLYARWTANPAFAVVYDPNSADTGTVPVENTLYEAGEAVVVSANTGTLERSGYVFTGWNLSSDGTGSTYTSGETITMGTGTITLYAKWSVLTGREWLSALACSADCKTVIAGGYQGVLHVSHDFGATWTETGPTRYWTAAAGSDDGMTLAAVDYWNGRIDLSGDGGATWTTGVAVLGQSTWNVALSADGQTIASAPGNGQIRISRDSGDTWQSYESSRNWLSLAMNSDGTRLAASSDTYIYLSSDSGTTWSGHDLASNGISYIMSMGMSDDGSRIIGSDEYAITNVVLSTDGGLTWETRDPAGDGSVLWGAVAVSSNGRYLIAIGYSTIAHENCLYGSSDYGATWTMRDTYRAWHSVDISADGRRMVANTANLYNIGNIYTSADYGVTWTPRY